MLLFRMACLLTNAITASVRQGCQTLRDVNENEIDLHYFYAEVSAGAETSFTAVRQTIIPVVRRRFRCPLLRIRLVLNYTPKKRKPCAEIRVVGMLAEPFTQHKREN